MQGQQVNQTQLNELEQRFALESSAKVDAMTTELKERLDMREVELFYRDEQIKRLSQEMALIREEKQQLIDTSGDRVLKQLVDKGISFVALQPGDEHLNIPLNAMSSYLESPLDYFAEQNSVDKKLYKQCGVLTINKLFVITIAMRGFVVLQSIE